MNAVLKPVPIFHREAIDDVIEEITPLLTAHYKEIAHFQAIPLDPDYGRYARMEAAGVLRIFTARLDGSLIGYAIFAVDRSAHYHGSLQACQDILYVHPMNRGGLGLRLIRYCDRALKAEGVDVVRHHVKVAHNFGRMLEREGYELEDVIYVKRL